MRCGGKGSIGVMWSADEERVAILYRVIRDSLLIERKHLGKNVLGRKSSKIKGGIHLSVQGTARMPVCLEMTM